MSANQIQVLLDLAIKTYNDKNRNHHDLLQCEDLFLQALDGRVEIDGPDSQNVAYVHWYLGLVYAEMDDAFDKSEAHYTAAFKGYTDALNKASIASAHATMLVKKGNLILEEAEDAREDYDDALDAPAPQSAPTNQDESTGPSGKKNKKRAQRERKDSLLLTLAGLRDEAADTFKKAAELRSTAYNLTNGVARAGEKAKTAAKATKAKASAAPIIYKSPAQIMAILDKAAIGQKAAKRGLANAAAQHIKRMQLSPEARAKTDKSNVMLLGPTGCGKTLLTQGLAGAINVPFYSTTATKLTASGYVGEDVQSVLVGLLRACDFDVERAQNGIIFIDEIDKVSSNDTGLDVGGKSVQEELLTILEGTKISVPKDGSNKTKGEYIEIDTTNILFVMGGAFVGLSDIVSRRLNSDGTSIGFGANVRAKDADTSSCLKYATAEDFVKYGMIPEFIGRVPKRLVIKALTVDQLERILTETDKALVLQKRLLLASTTDVRFTKGSLRAIAEEAQKTGTHGRALREIMEQVLEPIVYDEPTVAIITADMVRNRNTEIDAKNGEDDGVQAPVPHDFIVDDDAVEETLTAALAEAEERKNHPSVPARTGRELVVIR
jgi:ATP-dependent Clp protease ATP-binding subunit ClpX